MKWQTTLVVGLVLTAVLVSAVGRAPAKGPAGHSNNHRAGQAAAHSSNAGSDHGKAKWSADPSRGWVRAGEGQKLEKPRLSSTGNADKGKAKSNEKTKGY